MPRARRVAGYEGIGANLPRRDEELRHLSHAENGASGRAQKIHRS
jgi:hypothetical protein